MFTGVRLGCRQNCRQNSAPYTWWANKCTDEAAYVRKDLEGATRPLALQRLALLAHIARMSVQSKLAGRRSRVLLLTIGPIEHNHDAVLASLAAFIPDALEGRLSLFTGLPLETVW